MSNPTDSGIASMTGDAALPRRNGELVFEEPWEGRAFGLAVTMNERGVYDWPDFRDRLVQETAHDEGHGHQTGYYERWLRALESLALDRIRAFIDNRLPSPCQSIMGVGRSCPGYGNSIQSIMLAGSTRRLTSAVSSGSTSVRPCQCSVEWYDHIYRGHHWIGRP